MAKDFTYLRDWIYYPNPRPIILECERSKSGLSMAVYDREVKIFAIGGCGFDRLGCAIARVLETVFPQELEAADLEGMYGARRYNGKVNLEGMTGYQCMQAIGEKVGLKIGVYDSHRGTIILIAKLGA